MSDTDPEKQFHMLKEHITQIRRNLVWRESDIVVFVEHNLGFEAEHHERALRHLYKVQFYRDMQRQRVGILTTLAVKHSMCTLLNAMLRENRICLLDDTLFVSRDTVRLKILLKEELQVFSYQFKSASTIFSKDQCALSGKVGGMRDDLAMALQLAVYWTQQLQQSALE